MKLQKLLPALVLSLSAVACIQTEKKTETVNLDQARESLTSTEKSISKMRASFKRFGYKCDLSSAGGTKSVFLETDLENEKEVTSLEIHDYLKDDLVSLSGTTIEETKTGIIMLTLRSESIDDVLTGQGTTIGLNDEGNTVLTSLRISLNLDLNGTIESRQTIMNEGSVNSGAYEHLADISNCEDAEARIY